MAVTIRYVTQNPEQTGERNINPNQTWADVVFNVGVVGTSATILDDVLNAVDPSTGLTLPAVGSIYSAGNPSLILQKQLPTSISKSGLGFNWKILCHYVVDVSITGAGTATPWTRKPLFDYNLVRYPFVMEYQIQDDPEDPPLPVLNSAGDPFDPPLMHERINSLLRLRWARTVSSYDLYALQRSLVGTINEDAVTITGVSRTLLIPAKGALLRGLTGPEMIFQGGVHYWDLSIEIEIQKQVPLLYLMVQDKGYHYLDSGGKKHYIWLPADAGDATHDPVIPPSPSSPCGSPQLLNGVGGTLNMNNIPILSVLKFQKAARASWSPLQLT